MGATRPLVFDAEKVAVECDNQNSSAQKLKLKLLEVFQLLPIANIFFKTKKPKEETDQRCGTIKLDEEVVAWKDCKNNTNSFARPSNKNATLKKRLQT